MLLDFFTPPGKTFVLSAKSSSIKNLPLLCSSKSKVYPHHLPEINIVSPRIKFPEPRDQIPMFVAVEGKNVLNLDDLSKQAKNVYLILWPNVNEIPEEASDNLSRNYWKTIKPMIVCRGLANYYLGELSDENRVLFEICSESEAQCWVESHKSVISDSDSLRCYRSWTKDNNTLKQKIYLRKIQ